MFIQIYDIGSNTSKKIKRKIIPGNDDLFKVICFENKV